MPSRRDQIAMTPDEVDAYIRSQPRIIIVSNGIGGYPHPMPMNFTVDDEGRILITTFAKSQKVRNFERDSRATLLIESGIKYEELKSVIIYAQAEILRDRAAITAAHLQMSEKVQTLPEQTPEKLQQIAAAAKKRAIIRFTPERIISWDHSKLGGVY